MSYFFALGRAHFSGCREGENIGRKLTRKKGKTGKFFQPPGCGSNFRATAQQRRTAGEMFLSPARWTKCLGSRGGQDVLLFRVCWVAFFRLSRRGEPWTKTTGKKGKMGTKGKKEKKRKLFGFAKLPNCAYFFSVRHFLVKIGPNW